VNERDQALAHAKAGVVDALASYGATSDPAIRAAFAALIDAVAGLIEAVELSEINMGAMLARRLMQDATP
jgi:hypothetical protein